MVELYREAGINVVEAILQIWERRDQVRGYRFIEQAPWLRHFTAQFEAVSGEQ